jgi:FdhD protein
MDIPAGLRSVPCRQFKDQCWRDFDDVVTPETRIRVVLDDQESELWAYPFGLEDLALGHALLDLCPHGRIPALEQVEGERFFLRSAPGAAHTRGPLPGGALAGEFIVERMGEFVAGAERWEATGCFHRAGALDPASGVFLAVVEDVGRHNCIDRLAGFCLRTGADPGRLALFVSARATASLMDKIGRAGFPLVVSRSAVTTAGRDVAVDQGLTLAGFARPGRFTVFHDPGRRILDPGAC